MTPDQALQILDQMVARAPATRADHVMGQQALQVLADLVTAGGQPGDPLKGMTDAPN